MKSFFIFTRFPSTLLFYVLWCTRLPKWSEKSWVKERPQMITVLKKRGGGSKEVWSWSQIQLAFFCGVHRAWLIIFCTPTLSAEYLGIYSLRPFQGHSWCWPSVKHTMTTNFMAAVHIFGLADTLAVFTPYPGIWWQEGQTSQIMNSKCFPSSSKINCLEYRQNKLFNYRNPSKIVKRMANSLEATGFFSS